MFSSFIFKAVWTHRVEIPEMPYQQWLLSDVQKWLVAANRLKKKNPPEQLIALHAAMEKHLFLILDKWSVDVLLKHDY